MKSNKLIFFLILVFCPLFSHNLSFAQKNLITSRVFPSARWSWGGVTKIDSDWKDSQGNIIMTKDEIDRWTAAHADWFVPGFPSDNQLQANPNLRGAIYKEWSYSRAAGYSYQMWKDNSGKYYDNDELELENFYLSKNLDPETPFFHLTEDYYWQTDAKMHEDNFSTLFTFNNNYTWLWRNNYYYQCLLDPSFDSQKAFVTTSSYLAIARQEPFDSIYFEWQVPPQGGKYILEYVSKTTTTDNGLVIPDTWSSLQIISNETNNFQQDGLVRFKQPDRWKEWKRAVLSLVAGAPARKHYWVRLRTIEPPTNKPILSCVWANSRYQPLPLLKDNGDSAYFNFKNPTNYLRLEFLTPATKTTPFVLEYSVATDSSNYINSWKSLTNFTDQTAGLTKDGLITINTLPSDWQRGILYLRYKTEGKAPLRYYLRLRLTATSSAYIVIKKIYAYRQLLSQEIYANKYYLQLPGWDSRNDRNNDGYVDDDEFVNLVNPQATARFRWQSRVMKSGWQGSLTYPVNFNLPELKEFYRTIFERNLINSPSSTNAFFSDSIVQSSPILSGSKIAESAEDITNWEKAWNEIHAYLREKWKGRYLVGGNPASFQPYTSWKNLSTDTQFYTHKYLDYLEHEGWPHGWGTTYLRSFVDRLLNFAQETGNKMYQVLQFNMQWNNLLNVGGSEDATGWYRFLEHSLAYFYLLQHPDLSFLSIWTSVWYGNKIDTFPIGTMPRTMAYQPTKMLKVDIGKPANTIPQGYKPLILGYYSYHPQYRGNFILGDTTMSYLNNPNFPLMHNKPIYPTYIFILATGTLPKATTYNQYAIFARQYTKGLVLLKMTDNSGQYYTDDNSLTTHPLPGLYRRVNWDGTLGPVINQISLKGMEGAILVKAEDYPPGSEIITDFKKYLKIALFADNYNPQSGDIITYQAILRNISTTTLIRTKFSFPLFSDQKYIQNSAYLTINNVKYYSISYRPHQLIISIPYLSPKQQITLTWKMRK